MTAEERPLDWRVLAVWTAIFVVSIVTRTYVGVADMAWRGHPVSFDRVLAI